MEYPKKYRRVMSRMPSDMDCLFDAALSDERRQETSLLSLLLLSCLAAVFLAPCILTHRHFCCGIENIHLRFADNFPMVASPLDST